LAGCLGVPEHASSPEPVSLPLAVLDTFTLTESRNGVPEWTLTAPEAEGDPSADMTVSHPRLVVFDGSGRITSTVVAGSAAVQRPMKTVVARGGVTIVSQDGVIVTAD